MVMLAATTEELEQVAFGFGTTGVLFRDNQYGGNVIYRKVASLADAVACGGVLFIERSTSATLGFIGDSCREWLKAGGQSPRLTCVVSNEIDVTSQGGYRKTGAGKANPDIFQENTWRLSVGGDVAFAGIVTRAQTGFLSSRLHGMPFHEGVIRKIRLSSDGARYQPGASHASRRDVEGEYLPWMAPDDKGSVAFMVTATPSFASLKTVLLQMQPAVAGTGDAAKYVDQAYPLVLDTFEDSVPALRTIWARHDGSVHHGPGAQRAVFGTSRRFRLARMLHDGQDPSMTVNFLARDPDAGVTAPAGPLGLIGDWLAPAESSTEDFQDDFREATTYYGILPYGREQGPLGLPCLAEIPNWAFELKDLAGANTIFNYGVYDGVSAWTPAGTACPTIDGDFAADASTTVTAPTTYIVPALPAATLAGVIGSTNAWETHRHSLVGQYMLNDGTRRTPLRTAAWTEFLLTTMPEIEVYNCPPGEEFASPEAKLAALKSNAVGSTVGVPRPYKAWQTWGYDVYDDTWYWVDEISRKAMELAIADN